MQSKIVLITFDATNLFTLQIYIKLLNANSRDMKKTQKTHA